MRLHMGGYVKKAEVLERVKIAGKQKGTYVIIDFNNLTELLEFQSAINRELENCIKEYEGQFELDILKEINKDVTNDELVESK